MNKLKKRTIILFFLSHSAIAQVPKDFEAFYEPQVKEIKVRGVDGSLYPMPMLVTYNSVQLVASKAQTQALTQYLISTGVSESAASQIVGALEAGESNKLNCGHDLELCSLNPEKFEFYYDDHSSMLYLYINKRLLDEQFVSLNERRFAETHNSNAAFINHMGLFGSTDFNGEVNTSLSDEFIWSLPYGEFYFDGYLSNQENTSEINYGYYNIEHQDLRLTAGYHQERLETNATSFLLNGTQYHDWNVSVFSSANLAGGESLSQQKVYFYSPKVAVLKVYRSGRIIKQMNITEGQGSLSYTELPMGVYDIEIEISSGSNIISKEVVRIYNSSNETLARGQSDFSLTVGLLAEESSQLYPQLEQYPQIEGYEDLDSLQIENEAYVHAAYAYKMADSQTVALGLMATEKHYLSQFGLQGYLPFKTQYNLNFSSIDGKASYFNAYLSMGRWGASYEKLCNADNNVFASYIYGRESKEQLNLSTSYQIDREIIGYTTINYIEQQGRRQAYKSWYTSTGISMPSVVNSTLDINLNYSQSLSNDSLSMNQVSVSLNWSIPLSADFTAQFGTSFSEGGLSQYNTSLQSGDLLEREDLDGRIVLGNSYYANSTNSTLNNVSFYGTQSNEHYTSNGFIYFADDGEKAANISVNSSQIITRNRTLTTSNRADNYAIIGTGDTMTHDSEQSNGVVTIKLDKKSSTTRLLSEDVNIIGLDSYRSTKIEVDTESVALYNSGDKQKSGFTHPGSVLEVDAKVSKVISFISRFKDIFGNDISDLICQGDACINSESLSSGIYKVDVQEGIDFSLTSKGQKCYLPSIDDFSQLNFGENYCLPEIAQLDTMIMHSKGQKKYIIFLGGFDDDFVFDEKVNLPKEMKLMTVKQGKNTLLYLEYDKEMTLTSNQKQNLEQIAKMAINQPLEHQQRYVLTHNEEFNSEQ
ncbi:TcfC E-set like domain-containing protein [Vibrio vulnificus]|uniref:TcfC E-set like domain-containing protein n=1 Tax=Vibrio vulnificus TaxID=672 RepID=UPI001EE9CE7C|nr:TcfC E-set like domain-containing protein [Vibrio vulnificus]